MQAPHKHADKRLVLATIALQRFSLGARPHDINQMNALPQQWLLNQLTHSPAVNFDLSLPDSSSILSAQSSYQRAKKAFKQQQKTNALSVEQQREKMLNNNINNNKMSESSALEKSPNNPNRLFYKQLVADSLQQSIASEHSFNWRCLDFFSNHFSVTAQGSVMTGLAPTLEREAIAPHLFAHFEDLLLAVCQHPAMLIYLNNESSIGPSTRFAKKNKGLNENLAREILELHTLGVHGGYQQHDVTELAKGITGWSVAKVVENKHALNNKNVVNDKNVTNDKHKDKRGFIYRARRHEPGTRLLMGKSYPENGIKQGEQMLKDLANHPSTARFISTKIVQHFISDKPPEQLVNHLTEHWLRSHGHLKTVFEALITHPLAWQLQQQKYKTPREYVISTYRALAIKQLPIRQVQNALNTLGQAPFKAGSPAGYSDQQQNWDGASALMARINWISQLVAKKQLVNINIDKLIEHVFGHSLSTHSYQAITRAESRQQALILLLLCPEFLSR